MITSLSNAKIKHLVELQSKSRIRNKENVFVAEGFKMFEEAPADLIKEVYVEESALNRMEECLRTTPSSLLGLCAKKLNELKKSGTFTETVSGDVFKKASDTESPQGVLFVMKKLTYEFKDIVRGNVLVLEDIQDPGNLGTMIRTAEGAGFSGIIMSRGTVDIFNPKTIRSTMGSLYRVPFMYSDDILETVKDIKKQGTRVYAAHLKGVKNYDEIKYPGNSALLIGNEGNGLSDEISELADTLVRIPMAGKLESLNASVACAIMMYEIRK